eukprot:gene6371-7103_t
MFNCFVYAIFLGLSAVNIKGQNKTQHNSFDFNLRNRLTIEDDYDEKIDIQNSATLHETLDLSGEDTSVVTCSKKLSPDGVEQISIENFTKKVLSNARTIESVENNAVVFKDQSLRTKDTCASCEVGSISTEFEVLNALCSDVISEKDFRSASTKSTASHTYEQVFAQSPCELQLFYKTKDGETVEERGKRMKKTVVTLETVGNCHQNIEATQDESFTVHEALVWRYDPIIKQWNTNQTLAYVGEKKDFGSKEGACRDVFDFKHLNQDDPYGRYLGKRYKLDKYQDNPMSIAQYQQDIICQNTARFYGTLFNQKLYELSGEAVGQIQFLPTVLVELKNIKNDPERYFNVEPFMFGNFEKITNNMDHVVKEDVSGKNLLLAFSHFSYCKSKGELIVVDIQGWTSQDKRGFHFLTDPQIHTIDRRGYGTGNLGRKGMNSFWQKQHKVCNEVCRSLNLDQNRPACHDLFPGLS